MLGIDDVERILARQGPELLPGENRTAAAVALLLHDEPSGLQVLLIERATHDGDPWSGNVGLPGGKVEESDGDARTTAERETREEVGLDLREERYLGRLSDITGAYLPILVSCFVYGIGCNGALHLSEEVRDAFWVPLEELFDPERHGEASVRFGGQTLISPAIRLSRPGKPVLWGITYRLVMQFLGLLEGHDNDTR